MRSLITEEARNLFELEPGLPAAPAIALPGLSRSIRTICFISPLPSEGDRKESVGWSPIATQSSNGETSEVAAPCESTSVNLDRRSRKACEFGPVIRSAGG
jgi:hypothetical protein